MSTVDDEAAVLDSDSGFYYSLNPMATRMVGELLAPPSDTASDTASVPGTPSIARVASRIAATLANEFDASPEEIEADIAELVRTLLEKRLIVETSAPDANPKA